VAVAGTRLAMGSSLTEDPGCSDCIVALVVAVVKAQKVEGREPV
jgi:hypothetical protein